MVNTETLIQKIKDLEPKGVQVQIKTSLLSTTSAVYYHKNKIYRFLMQEDFNFSSENGFTEDDFLKAYKDWLWEIELSIY